MKRHCTWTSEPSTGRTNALQASPGSLWARAQCAGPQSLSSWYHAELLKDHMSRT